MIVRMKIIRDLRLGVFDVLMNVIYNERLEDIPKILETPYVDREYPPYKYEIEMIKNKKFDNELIAKIRN